ncbi:MAG: choice-of-anchor X domain-containing protein [Candidatus Eisenbacteria bacterium]
MNKKLPRACRQLFLLIPVAVVVSACSSDLQRPSYDSPLDSGQDSTIPIPDSLLISVGDGSVRLAWSLPPGGSVDEYAVLRRDGEPGSGEVPKTIGRVAGLAYVDSGVRNGRTYYYSVAAVVQGQSGPRTEELAASPGLFAITLAGGADYTAERTIAVDFDVPSAEAVRLSENPDAFTAPWQPATGTLQWTLSAGDGEKTVHARFRFADGSSSLPVFDAIRLDTYALIESLVFDGGSVRAPGDTLHFRMATGESYGTAEVTVAGLFEAVRLLDDGTNGDGTAGDGVYERDMIIPAGTVLTGAEVRGGFTDEAGNQAAPLSAPQRLTVRQDPEPVSLLSATVAASPAAPAVTLYWSVATDQSFFAYRILRSETAPIDPGSADLVALIPDAAVVQFRDSFVVEGGTYYYQVYVQNDFGAEAASNTASAFVANTRPPGSIVLSAASSVGAGRIALEWSPCADPDFLSYRLYRNESGAVDEADFLVAEIRDAARIYWDDAGLEENTRYAYRIYLRDQGELISRSNEVTFRTLNEAPAPVTLGEATAVGGGAATLSWTTSTAHDFAYYRLYRDVIPGVTTSSALVVQMEADPTFTSYRDTQLSPGTRYYYRVFVIDDAETPAAAGSNTISLVAAATAEE